PTPRSFDRVDERYIYTWLAEGGSGSEFQGSTSSTETDVAIAKERDLRSVPVEFKNTDYTLSDGSIVIAAITSCTNTSNPSVMIGAGLVAQKALKRGLRTKSWVKTSLASGSKVVTQYLDRSGLTEDLDALRFHTVGYGCTSCIGNSGPLPPHIG